ncbi:MAG: LysE family transporter [Chlamydiales bacterium]|nr:LysE family transporter [Chlamydiales bacterium]
MLFAFLKGITLGFSLVTPLGAQNAFIFNQATFRKNYRSILPVVAVSAGCDALLILLAVLGVNVLLFSPALKPILLFSGSLFLCYLGIRTWKTTTALELRPAGIEMSLPQEIFHTLSVSLLNPPAIIDTFVVIASVSSNYIGLEKHAFSLGCILIDAVWLLGLSICGFHLRKMKNSMQIINIINRLSSVIMIIVAMDLFLTFTKSLNI